MGKKKFGIFVQYPRESSKRIAVSPTRKDADLFAEELRHSPAMIIHQGKVSVRPLKSRKK